MEEVYYYIKMNINELIQKLAEISAEITPQSTSEDIRYAGSRIIGLTIANPDFDQKLYSQYSLLEDIVDYARHIDAGDFSGEPYDTWNEVQWRIEQLCSQ